MRGCRQQTYASHPNDPNCYTDVMPGSDSDLCQVSDWSGLLACFTPLKSVLSTPPAPLPATKAHQTGPILLVHNKNRRNWSKIVAYFYGSNIFMSKWAKRLVCGAYLIHAKWSGRQDEKKEDSEMEVPIRNAGKTARRARLTCIRRSSGRGCTARSPRSEKDGGGGGRGGAGGGLSWG
mmetsp:Transcript_107992/g.182661  ORF Transcript_107992/g.182661 Transcript_107992/m.182661 type:complete len:178 (-) Transcript_107992:270-803(-)